MPDPRDKGDVTGASLPHPLFFSSFFSFFFFNFFFSALGSACSANLADDQWGFKPHRIVTTYPPSTKPRPEPQTVLMRGAFVVGED